MNTDDYHLAPSGIGPLAADWKDKPHRLVYDLVGEVERLQKLLWLRHDPEHFAGLYGDDGEMQCGACGLDFRRMDAKQLAANWQEMGLRKLAQVQVDLKCQDCGGGDAIKGFCPFAQDVHNRDVPVVLCKDCRHERAMAI